MLVSSALDLARRRGVDRVDAQWLVLLAAARSPGDRAWLLANTEAEVDGAKFWEAIQRRLVGEPMAYILGSRGFYGLELQVDARVLDPRPDTETLVDWALELALPAGAAVIDLGTGSGAIALALASQRSGWRVHATDLSADALAVARGNAERLGLSVGFSHGAWFDALPAASRFHLITSNPPYIAEGDPHLAKLTHEPAMALTSGADGLDAIRHIVSHAPGHLLPGGWLLLEHGYDQAERVRELMIAAGFAQVQSRQDLGGNDRCTGGQI